MEIFSRLRAAAPPDLDAICALDAASFSQPWPRASFAYALSDAASILLVATREIETARVLAPPGVNGASEKIASEKIIGFGAAQVTLDECEILTLAVAPEMRGAKLGARLLDELLRFATERGAARVFLEVRPSNAAARALYARRGFAEVGRRRAYYRDGEDALLLRREYSQSAPLESRSKFDVTDAR